MEPIHWSCICDSFIYSLVDFPKLNKDFKIDVVQAAAYGKDKFEIATLATRNEADISLNVVRNAVNPVRFFGESLHPVKETTVDFPEGKVASITLVLENNEHMELFNSI